MYHTFRDPHPAPSALAPILCIALGSLLGVGTGCAGGASSGDDAGTPTMAADGSDQALEEGSNGPSARTNPAERRPGEDCHDGAGLPLGAPPNPATHRPPMDNPCGVDRDRPPRPIPGLDR